VEEGGRRRKVVVCMPLPGEDWEKSADALCNSRVIVALVSRQTFVLQNSSDALSSEGNHKGASTFHGLTAESQADDILWQWCLSLEISSIGRREKTIILPVLIGDVEATETENDRPTIYTDFLTSECVPLGMPNVRVQALQERLEFYLHTRFHCAGRMSDAGTMAPGICAECRRRPVRKWTVDDIVEGIFKLQAINVSGLKESAWSYAGICLEAAVRHTCVQGDILRLQHGRPCGQEVVDWLQEYGLGDYAGTIARLGLDSLHLISRLSAEQTTQICEEAVEDELGTKSVTGHAQSQTLGIRIRLESAIQSLVRDLRSKSLCERRDKFKDRIGSVLNLVWRENQVIVVLQHPCGLCFVLLLHIIFALFGGWMFADHLGDPFFRLVPPGRVTSFQVERSFGQGPNNTWQWQPVVCGGTPCIFNSSAAAVDDIVHAHFPVPVQARYFRILPASWAHSNSMRVGLIGTPQSEPLEGVATVGLRASLPELNQNYWHRESCQKKLGALCSRNSAKPSESQICSRPGFDMERCVVTDVGLKCYSASKGAFSWAEASDRCKQWGGELAEILSEEEGRVAHAAAAAVRNAQGIAELWIGHRDDRPQERNGGQYSRWYVPKCYKVFGQTMTFARAEQECREWGNTTLGGVTQADGSLASVTSSQEASFLSKLVASTLKEHQLKNATTVFPAVSFGLNRRQTRNFVWPDGLSPIESYWSAGHPTTVTATFPRNCAAMTSGKWSENWVSVDCALELVFACSRVCREQDPPEWRVHNFADHEDAHCAKIISEARSAEAGLVNSDFVVKERDAVVLDVLGVRQVAGVLMQGGMDQRDTLSLSLAMHFSALYACILSVPMALNLVVHASATVWALNRAAYINLLYATLVSTVGLALVYSHDSMVAHITKDWRADVTVRLEASILFISGLLVVIQKLAPQAFLVAAFLATVTAAGFQMIEHDATDQTGWERRYSGVNVLLAGYGMTMMVLLAKIWRTHRIKARTIMEGHARHLEIWSQAIQGDRCFVRCSCDDRANTASMMPTCVHTHE